MILLGNFDPHDKLISVCVINMAHRISIESTWKGVVIPFTGEVRSLRTPQKVPTHLVGKSINISFFIDKKQILEHAKTLKT